MSVWESVLVAWEGLRAHKMRSALTMLGVIIGVAAVITMLAVASGAKEKMMSRIQSMGTNILFVRPGQARRGPVMRGAGSSETLTLRDSDAIAKKCPSIEKCAPEVSSMAQVKYGNVNTSTTIRGTDVEYLGVRNYEVEHGRFFSQSEIKTSKKVAVIGPTAAENLVGDEYPVGKKVRIKGIQFTIIGVMKEKGAGGFGDPDDQIYVPITTAMNRVFGLDHIGTISAQAYSMQVMDQAVEEITELLRERHRIREGSDNDFHVRNQADIVEMASEAAGIFTLLLGGIASVSLLVGGIGIMNIMLVSVTERTREIGIRMAIGARRRDIQRQFLIEAMVLSLVGGVIGILAGGGMSATISHMTELNAKVLPSSIILAFCFSAFVGIFFGIYPARKASALDPIDALRYE